MSNKPSLLWISHFLPYPLDLGASIRSFNLILHLAHHFNLTLIILDTKRTKSNQEHYFKLLSILEKEKVLIHYITIPSSESILQKGYLFLKSFFTRLPIELDLFYSREAEQKISPLMADSYDYIYFDSIDLAKYFHLAELKKAFLNHHNVESSLLQSMSHSKKPNFFYRRQAKLMKSLEFKYCPQFRANFAVSDLDSHNLKSATAGVFHTIPNGVDTDGITYKNGSNTGLLKIGWLGGLNWSPNKEGVIWFLNEVWPTLSELYPQLELHLAGVGTEELKSDLNQNVISHGYLTDIEQYMESLDLFIVPLLTGGGTRLKILDAFARGIPVVSTSKGAEGITVTHGENILIADNSKDFAEIFKKLKNHEFDLDNIRKNARVLVESNYNWPRISTKMAKLIKGNL